MAGGFDANGNVLVRQVEPGSRLRAAVCLNADLLPLPEDETVADAVGGGHAPRGCAARPGALGAG
jgi:hypothetical protein